MVRPKISTIKRERARREWNCSEVFYVRPIRAWVEPRDAPFFGLVRHVFVLSTAKDIQRAIDKSVTTDFGANMDIAPDIPFAIVLENALLVPLAHIEMLAVEAEIRSGEVRAGEQFSESAPFVVTINVAIIVQPFANRETPAVICKYTCPDDSRWINLAGYFPRFDVDSGQRPEIA